MELLAHCWIYRRPGLKNKWSSSNENWADKRRSQKIKGKRNRLKLVADVAGATADRSRVVCTVGIANRFDRTV